MDVKSTISYLLRVLECENRRGSLGGTGIPRRMVNSTQGSGIYNARGQLHPTCRKTWYFTFDAGTWYEKLFGGLSVGLNGLPSGRGNVPFKQPKGRGSRLLSMSAMLPIS